MEVADRDDLLIDEVANGVDEDLALAVKLAHRASISGTVGVFKVVAQVVDDAV
jgi:hypothetical protein